MNLSGSPIRGATMISSALTKGSDSSETKDQDNNNNDNRNGTVFPYTESEQSQVGLETTKGQPDQHQIKTITPNNTPAPSVRLVSQDSSNPTDINNGDNVTKGTDITNPTVIAPASSTPCTSTDVSILNPSQSQAGNIDIHMKNYGSCVPLSSIVMSGENTHSMARNAHVNIGTKQRRSHNLNRSRPGSGCSQHSTTSITSVSVSVPITATTTARTTTSRRGGRACVSRRSSPIMFLNHPNNKESSSANCNMVVTIGSNTRVGTPLMIGNSRGLHHVGPHANKEAIMMNTERRNVESAIAATGYHSDDLVSQGIDSPSRISRNATIGTQNDSDGLSSVVTASAMKKAGYDESDHPMSWSSKHSPNHKEELKLSPMTMHRNRDKHCISVDSGLGLGSMHHPRHMITMNVNAGSSMNLYNRRLYDLRTKEEHDSRLKNLNNTHISHSTSASNMENQNHLYSHHIRGQAYSHSQNDCIDNITIRHHHHSPNKHAVYRHGHSHGHGGSSRGEYPIGSSSSEYTPMRDDANSRNMFYSVDMNYRSHNHHPGERHNPHKNADGYNKCTDDLGSLSGEEGQGRREHETKKNKKSFSLMNEPGEKVSKLQANGTKPSSSICFHREARCHSSGYIDDFDNVQKKYFYSRTFCDNRVSDNVDKSYSKALPLLSRETDETTARVETESKCPGLRGKVDNTSHHELGCLSSQYYHSSNSNKSHHIELITAVPSTSSVETSREFANNNNGLSSVFRDRPMGSAEQKKYLAENSQIKNDSMDLTNTNNTPLSPEAPPQIQHSHHQYSSNSLFFEPQRSPINSVNIVSSSNAKKTEEREDEDATLVIQPSSDGNSIKTNISNHGTINVVNSFSLFNQSFDSLGDTVPCLNPNDDILDTGPVIDSTASFPQVPSVDENSPIKQQTGPSFLPGVGLSFSPQRLTTYQEGHDTRNSGCKCPPLFNGQSSTDRISLVEGTGLTPSNSFGGGIITLDDGEEKGQSATSKSLDLEHTTVASPLVHPIIQNRNSFNSTFGSSSNMNGEHSTSITVCPSPNDKAQAKYIHPEEIYCKRKLPVSGARVLSNRKDDQNQSPNSKSTVEIKFPHFYHILLCHKHAFGQCTFLLPGLNAALPIKDACDVSLLPNIEDDNNHSQCTTIGCSQKGGNGTENVESNTPNRMNMNIGGPTVSYSPETQTLLSMSELSPPTNVDIACRRVKSAICAFGGNHSSYHNTDNNFASSTMQSSIFRNNGKESYSSHTMKYEADDAKSFHQPKTEYVEQLSSRYYESDNRLSWEIEESPPVDINHNHQADSLATKVNNKIAFVSTTHTKRMSLSSEDSAIRRKTKLGSMDVGDKVDISKGCQTTTESNHIRLTESSKFDQDSHRAISIGDKDMSTIQVSSSCSDQPKMRYRCKLCGQPKQNHTCSFQQSLQRSIGIMIYPAVNAFTACEPGYLAPALADMNNFVTESESSSPESTPSRPSPSSERSMDPTAMSGSIVMSHQLAGPIKVTPETLTLRRTMQHHNLRHSSTINSPVSSMSTLSETPQRSQFCRTPGSITSNPGSTGSRYSIRWTKGIPGHHPTPKSGLKRKRALSDETTAIKCVSDLLFVEATDLRPEQYRIVSVCLWKGNDAFNYPSLPLPYAQRKRLSDNLFTLSKEVPHLTDECALVLREAREKDMWDVAVAELMTQVVVVRHCSQGDLRLDGLSQYLLQLGFAC